MNNAATATTYTISDLANEFGITTRTIRFYEDQGLLSPRREGRRRIYERRDRTRLQLILRGKRLGFSLGEVRELFGYYDRVDGEERQLQRYLQILGERRAKLEMQRRDIEAELEEIRRSESQCRSLLEQSRQQNAEVQPESATGR